MQVVASYNGSFEWFLDPFPQLAPGSVGLMRTKTDAMELGAQNIPID